MSDVEKLKIFGTENQSVSSCRKSKIKADEEDRVEVKEPHCY